MTFAVRATYLHALLGPPALGCIVKRDYTLALARAPAPCDVPPPLVDLPVFVDPTTADELLHDADALVFLHPGVDVVVLGAVYAERATRAVDAAITIGAHQKKLRVFGDRVVERFARGRLRFSDPAPFERMPLTYRRAYGGSCASAPPYPRNPLGVGYAPLEQSGRDPEGMRIPNFEDPADLLSCDRWIGVASSRWFDAPLPAGLGCLMPYGFPRAAALFRLPPEDAARVLARERPDMEAPTVPDARAPIRSDPGSASCASFGLRCLPLRGDEPLALERLHPDAQVVASRLPADVVTVTFELPGGRTETARAALRRVLLAPEHRRMTLTFAATLPLDDALPASIVDGVRVVATFS